MNIQIFSLPQGFIIPDPSWLITPAQANRVTRFAHTSLAKWTIDQLSSRKTLLTFVGVISVIGVGVAIYMLHLPGIVIGGLSATICLLGYKGIHREQIARLEKICLEIEDWLIPLKQICEKLDPLLYSFKDKVSQNKTPLATYQSIYDLIQQLPSEPDKQIEQFTNELKAQHLALFGEYHRIGEGQCTTYWISNYFGGELKSRIRHFYAAINTFTRCFLTLQQDPQNVNHQQKLYTATYLFCFYKDAKVDGSFALTNSLEQNQQSIAAFRSSLHW